MAVYIRGNSDATGAVTAVEVLYSDSNEATRVAEWARENLTVSTDDSDLPIEWYATILVTADRELGLSIAGASEIP